MPVPYFHVVLTLPHELNDLLLANKRPMLNLLFHAGAETLLQFGQNRFGGRIGFTMILHTWDQMLRPHFHLHCLVPAGALAADHRRWVPGDPKFLFPVHALSRVFRGKFLDGLRRLGQCGRLTSHTDALDALVNALRRKPWVVYAKKPFAGPQRAFVVEPGPTMVPLIVPHQPDTAPHPHADRLRPAGCIPQNLD